MDFCFPMLGLWAVLGLWLITVQLSRIAKAIENRKGGE